MDREIIIAAAAEKYYTARRHFEAIGMCNTFGLDALERSKLATRYEMARSDMIAAKGNWIGLWKWIFPPPQRVNRNDALESLSA